MLFGMIGAGTVSRAIAGHALRTGHDVVFCNSRGPETLAGLVEELGPHASAGTLDEVGDADFVVLAVNWTVVREALRDLKPRDGRIVVDATNQWASLTPVFVPDELDVGGSELVASLIPGARVIKAFNAMYGPVTAEDPVHPTGRRVLFYAGDDVEAKEDFRRVVEDDMGFAGVDLGALRNGRLMQVGGGPLSGLHVIRQDTPHPEGARGAAGKRRRSTPSLFGE
ncbi:MAG: NAD(P)-binding domain-containing protein [Umezawaea sp.]